MMRCLKFAVLLALPLLGCFASESKAGPFGLFGPRWGVRAGGGSCGAGGCGGAAGYQYNYNYQQYRYAAPQGSYYYQQQYQYITPNNTVQPAAPACGPNGCPVPQRPAAYQPQSGDPHGFIGWLNGVRARHGLRALSHDPNLSAWAHQNNYAQLRAGFSSHHVNPNCWQVAFVGPADAISAGDGWMRSPSHASALLNPSVTMVGIAGDGNAWTANLR